MHEGVPCIQECVLLKLHDMNATHTKACNLGNIHGRVSHTIWACIHSQINTLVTLT